MIKRIPLFNAACIVMGLVVGSGIFVSSADIARRVPSGWALLALWLVTGLVTLAGALSQCELASQIPKSGGPYEFFRHAYGDSFGFLYGWANFVVAGAGAIAGIAYTFSNFLNEVIPLPRWEGLASYSFSIPFLGTFYPGAEFGIKVSATVLITGLTWINVRGLKLGAGVQAVSLIAKITAIVAVICVAFFFSGGAGTTANWASVNPSFQHINWLTTLGAMALAMGSAFWAYDGWGAITYISGEVENPKRNVPRAILYGCIGFISLYLIINLAYLYVLPLSELGAVPKDRVASALLDKIGGAGTGIWIALLVMLSTFDTTNATILTNGRVYQAMAKDGLFLRAAGRLHSRYGTPSISLTMQATWALVLLWTGSFDAIISMYIFVNWAMYALIGISLFVLRIREPDRERPFKVPGYPVVPALFVIFSVGFVVLTVVGDWKEFSSGAQPVFKSLVGLVLVLLGTPVYFLVKRSARPGSPAK